MTHRAVGTADLTVRRYTAALTVRRYTAAPPAAEAEGQRRGLPYSA